MKYKADKSNNREQVAQHKGRLGDDWRGEDTRSRAGANKGRGGRCEEEHRRKKKNKNPRKQVRM